MNYIPQEAATNGAGDTYCYAASGHHVQLQVLCCLVASDMVQGEAERDLDISPLRMEQECIDLGASM